MDYILPERPPAREETVAARVTRSDRRLLEAAAEGRGTTLSRYIAQVSTEAARRELLEPEVATV